MSDVSSFLTNDGVKLVYDKRGSGETSLIMIHGFSGSRRHFDLNIDSLAQGCTVYRLDLRFHGDSDKPAWGHFVCRLAADVHDFIHHLGLKSHVVLLGTSMGCSIIWAYCMLYGIEGLKGAIFVDQVPLQDPRPDWAIGGRACNDPTMRQNMLNAAKDISNLFDLNAKHCLTKPIDPSYYELLRNETKKSNGDALHRLFMDHTQIDWRPILPTIELKSLNIIGGTSGIFFVEGVEAVGKLMPNCQSITFSEDNHWLYMENPEKFNTTVLEFIAGLSDVTP